MNLYLLLQLLKEITLLTLPLYDQETRTLLLLKEIQILFHLHL